MKVDGTNSGVRFGVRQSSVALMHLLPLNLPGTTPIVAVLYDKWEHFGRAKGGSRPRSDPGIYFCFKTVRQGLKRNDGNGLYR